MRWRWVLVMIALVGCSDGPGPDPGPSAAPTASATAALTAQATAPPAAVAPSADPSAPAEERVVLQPDGFGLARFGDGTEDVIAALSRRYGQPEDDSDWLPAEGGDIGFCPGGVVRVVRWGQVAALFSDGPTDYGPAGTRHLFGYSVVARGEDPAAELGDGPQTDAGIGVGSTLADVRAAYGDGVEVREDEVYGPIAVIGGEQGRITAYLTDVGDAAVVAGLSGGQACAD